MASTKARGRRAPLWRLANGGSRRPRIAFTSTSTTRLPSYPAHPQAVKDAEALGERINRLETEVCDPARQSISSLRDSSSDLSRQVRAGRAGGKESGNPHHG